MRRKPVRAVGDNTKDFRFASRSHAAMAKDPVVGTWALDIAKSPLKSAPRVYCQLVPMLLF